MDKVVQLAYDGEKFYALTKNGRLFIQVYPNFGAPGPKWKEVAPPPGCACMVMGASLRPDLQS